MPFGTHVYLPIPGVLNPYRLVDDTGGGMRRMARKGLIQFDVRFVSHAEALRFGSRWTDVYVLLEDPTPEQTAFFGEYALFSWDATASDPLAALTFARTEYASLVHP